MLTWRLDQLFRSASACALGAAGLPLVIAGIVSRTSEVDNVFGVFVFAAAVMLLATILGSPIAMAFAVALFGIVAVIADIGATALAFIGAGLFASIILHDLSATLRRSPGVDNAVWKNAAAVTIMVCVTGGVLFTIAHYVATRATWQAAAVPLALLTIGIVARVVADSHVDRVRR